MRYGRWWAMTGGRARPQFYSPTIILLEDFKSVLYTMKETFSFSREEAGMCRLWWTKTSQRTTHYHCLFTGFSSRFSLVVSCSKQVWHSPDSFISAAVSKKAQPNDRLKPNKVPRSVLVLQRGWFTWCTLTEDLIHSRSSWKQLKSRSRTLRVWKPETTFLSKQEWAHRGGRSRRKKDTPKEDEPWVCLQRKKAAAGGGGGERRLQWEQITSFLSAYQRKAESVTRSRAGRVNRDTTTRQPEPHAAKWEKMQNGKWKANVGGGEGMWGGWRDQQSSPDKQQRSRGLFMSRCVRSV